MRVSVVICTYAMDIYDDFAECVESVRNQTHDGVEIVIVVDGTADVYERVQADYGDDEDIVTHCNAENVGLLESRNTGVELATGDVVAFIDDDAVADEAWIERLMAAYDEQDAIAAGGRMTPQWVAGEPAYLPEEFYWLVGVTHRGFADGPGEVRNTFGSNIYFRRDVFRELGGFDSQIGGRQGDKNLQGGETELCARMREEYGHGVYYVPEATVAHKVFEYRTEFFWLVERAFWQGYSKRVMERLVPGSDDDETDFLKQLLAEFIPGRCTGLLRSPSVDGAVELLSVFLFTATVGAGYSYEICRELLPTVETAGQ